MEGGGKDSSNSLKFETVFASYGYTFLSSGMNLFLESSDTMDLISAKT